MRCRIARTFVLWRDGGLRLRLIRPTNTTKTKSLVLEFVFLVDLAVRLVRRRQLLAAERSRDESFARGVGVAAAGAGCDLFARHRRRLADDAARGAAHQVHMNVIVVIDVGAPRQHGGELLAGGALDVA